MDTLSYRTVSANKATANKEWYIVDAQNEIVGRLRSRIAMVLRGKHKTNYTPHADCGDYVIVINADKIRFTGKKMSDKEYITHSNYPGGQKITTPRKLLVHNPIAIVEKGVKGMLPKTKLGAAIYRNMFVYAGEQHLHEAQKPKILELNTIK